MKKLISMLLALAVCASCTACASGNASSTAATSSAAAADKKFALPTKENVSLTVWVPFTNTIISSMEKNPVVPLIKKETGIDLKFIHPAAGEESTALQLLFTSGNLPDIIRLDGGQNAALTYPGGGSKGVKDGVLVKLNDLIDKYAPNYKAIRKRGNEYSKDTISDDGTIWAMYTVANSKEEPWCGLGYRKDWADGLGLKAPVTIDDWHTLLTAFKEKKGAVAPLMIPADGIMANSEFLSAFGAVKTFYQVNGKVKYGFLESGMKDYVTLMSKWYKEGLIDHNFTTNADFKTSGDFVLPASYAAADKCGAGEISWAASNNGYYALYKATKNDKIDYGAVVPPVQKAGDATHFRYTTSPIYNPWVITSSCKHPEYAVELLDWAYGDQGFNTLNYGDPSNYTVKDNKKTFVKDMLYNDKYDFPTLLSSKTWEMGPGVRDFTKAYQNVDAKLLESSKVWASANSDYTIPSGVEMTSEEGSEQSQVMADINTLVKESIPKFITGATSMDKWDSFVSQIKSMNIDKAISVQQTAFDRYKKR